MLSKTKIKSVSLRKLVKNQLKVETNRKTKTRRILSNWLDKFVIHLSYFRAKQTEVQMSHKLNKLITNSNGVLLPSI